jgi:predicted TIM-barrel fold metal-dependent hydrolase
LPVPVPVRGTVVVEASSWVRDNDWLLELGQKDAFILGIVGNLPVGKEEFSTLLKRFSANPLFRGIRIGEQSLRSLTPSGEKHLGELADAGLTLDLLGGEGMLAPAAKLARKVPHLRLILDHVGGPDFKQGQVSSSWRDGIEACGQQPNIFCKLSGLVEATGKADGTAPADYLHYMPILQHVLAAFGEERLVYGSNWPVSERFASCYTVQQIVTEFCRSKSPRMEKLVLGENSRTFYQWKQRA